LITKVKLFYDTGPSIQSLLTLHIPKESWKTNWTIIFAIRSSILTSWLGLLFLLWPLRPGLGSPWPSFFVITTRRVWRWWRGARCRRSSWMLQE